MDEARIRDAVAGRAQTGSLTAAERAVANRRIDTAIEQRAGRINLGDIARAAGKTTVGLAGDGQIVWTLPDGTRRTVAVPDLDG
jgi:hypothetical protein